MSLRYLPGEATFFKGIRKLPAARALHVQGRTRTLETLWSPSYVPKHTGSERQIIDELDELMKVVVPEHLMSEVPLGCFLSGGIDSSLVVAYASAAGTEPLSTFAVGVDEESQSELPWARMVAERYGTRHTEQIAEPDVARLTPRMVAAFGPVKRYEITGIAKFGSLDSLGGATIAVFVLDAGIREPDVPIVVRQFMLTRPPCNLFGTTVRPPVAVLLAAIAFVEESLILALELVVEDDPSDLAAMDPLVLMKNLDHVRMTSRRLSYILQQQVHLYTPEANQLREQIDSYLGPARFPVPPGAAGLSPVLR